MILPYRGKWPDIHETAFVAPSSDLIGDVKIGAESSVWFQCVIRGDVNWIRIGERTNIQDHSMLHVTRVKSPLTIGDEVTVGHRVTLHGCRIGNRVLIGMGAIILDDAEIGDECIIGAGALVTKKMKIPPRSLVLGAPGKVVRALTDEELAYLAKSAKNYVGDTIEYRGYVQGPARLGISNADLDTLGSGFHRRLPRDLSGDLTRELNREISSEISGSIDEEFSGGVEGDYALGPDDGPGEGPNDSSEPEDDDDDNNDDGYKGEDR